MEEDIVPEPERQRRLTSAAGDRRRTHDRGYQADARLLGPREGRAGGEREEQAQDRGLPHLSCAVRRLAPDQGPAERVEVPGDVRSTPLHAAPLGRPSFMVGLTPLPEATVADHIHALAEQLPEKPVARRFHSRDDDEFTCHECLQTTTPLKETAPPTRYPMK